MPSVSEEVSVSVSEERPAIMAQWSKMLTLIVIAWHKIKITRYLAILECRK